MRTLISHYTEPNFLFRNPSFCCINQKPIFYFHRECPLSNHKTVPTSSVRASCTAKSAAICNGWDDLRVWVDSDELGESNHIKKLLITLGIYDKKYVFTCILGFVCALAISRVRVSSIIVFPATAIVFAIGFSFGFVNGGINKGLNSNGVKKRVKDDHLGKYVEKLKTLGKLFDGVDVKVGELKNVVKKAIDYARVELSDLEDYVSEMESIGGLILDGRKVVDDCIVSVSSEMLEVEANSSIRKKKVIENNGFNLFGFVRNFLSGDRGGFKTTRTNAMRRDSAVDGIDNRAQGAMQGSSVRRKSDLVSGMDASNPNSSTLDDDGRMNNVVDDSRERENVLRMGKTRTVGSHRHSRAFIDTGNGSFKHENTRFVDNQQFFHREIREWGYDDSVSYSEFDISNEHLKNESSLNSEQMFRNSSEAGESFQGRDDFSFRNLEASFEHESMNVDEQLHTRKYRSQLENDMNSFSSSAVSDDILFDKYLRKANDLLERAKKCLKVRNDEIIADELLYDSTKLLSEAISMKPMSLLAIGMLGNTYLLHGELKLRLSRTLRSLVSKRLRKDFDVERWSYLLASLDETLPNKDKVATLLVETCDECEALLIQAGRKYKLALAIDGSDVRALYNWGLALFFRAQLVADIGPDAALDADKLFLAAIDKFDAMMSRSNVYAPDALFRWGVALQQRSRLRPNSSRDKLKLLQQAKRLYEDALDMGSKNIQVKEALSSCMSELNFTDT